MAQNNRFEGAENEKKSYLRCRSIREKSFRLL